VDDIGAFEAIVCQDVGCVARDERLRGRGTATGKLACHEQNERQKKAEGVLMAF